MTRGSASIVGRKFWHPTRCDPGGRGHRWAGVWEMLGGMLCDCGATTYYQLPMDAAHQPKGVIT